MNAAKLSPEKGEGSISRLQRKGTYGLHNVGPDLLLQVGDLLLKERHESAQMHHGSSSTGDDPLLYCGECGVLGVLNTQLPVLKLGLSCSPDLLAL
jgi:hypothetical protein